MNSSLAGCRPTPPFPPNEWLLYALFTVWSMCPYAGLQRIGMATIYEVQCPHCERSNKRYQVPGKTLLCDWCGNRFACELSPSIESRRYCNTPNVLDADRSGRR